MAQPDEFLDSDLDAQLQGLFKEATAAAEKSTKPPAPEAPMAAPQPKAAPAQPVAPGGPSQTHMLQAVVRGLEGLSRTANESHQVLKRLDADASSTAASRQELPQIVADLRTLIDGKTGVNQAMFAALHEELKSYKDGFLLDSVHRPIIRDLIALYDDTAELQRQLGDAAAGVEPGEGGMSVPMGNVLKNIQTNLAHHVEFLAEVLNRLEVTRVDTSAERLDKATQRAVAVEYTEDPDADSTIVKTARKGFLWKGRVFRAEEVVIRKWKEGYFSALKSDSEQDSSVQGTQPGT